MKNMAGKVTVGLASHWPCITDSSGIPTYGLNGLGKGDEQFGLRTFALTITTTIIVQPLAITFNKRY